MKRYIQTYDAPEGLAPPHTHTLLQLKGVTFEVIIKAQYLPQ